MIMWFVLVWIVIKKRTRDAENSTPTTNENKKDLLKKNNKNK